MAGSGQGIFLIPVFLFACQAVSTLGAAERVRMDFSGPGMGTLFRIALYAEPDDRDKAERAVEDAWERLAELNAVFSDYEPNSEINRVAAAAPEFVAASPDLLRLTARALEIARITDGAFDPTCGPLTRLWRRTRHMQKPPPQDRLEAARLLTDWRRLEVDEAAGTVRLGRAGMLLDFGGIAKGYAADQMLAVLRCHHFPVALVQAGGDTAAGDPPPGQLGWEVRVEDGFAGTLSVQLRLARQGMSTSGDLHQSMEIDGERQSHILAPKQGIGLLGRSACSVVAQDATRSDALATAFSVLGMERGRGVAEAMGVAVRWVWQDQDGAIHTRWHFPAKP